MEQSPFEKGKYLLLKENNKRLRYLTEEEINDLLKACKGHILDIVECALNSGMRRGEILSLKWSQIKGGLIYLQKTKTNNARQIPINEDLECLFDEIKNRQNSPKKNVVGINGKAINPTLINSEYLFNYNGKHLSDVKRSFKRALPMARIEDFRFHDLRHTFASHFVMRGGTIKELQEILGHKNISMTMRYAHLSHEHKKKAVNLLNGLTRSVKSDMSQIVTSSISLSHANS